MSSRWGPTREPRDQSGQVAAQWWLLPGDLRGVLAAYPDGPPRPDLGGPAGVGVSMRTEPPPVDPDLEQEIAESVRRAVDRVGPHPPLTAAELAAHVHDLADARGQAPTLNDHNRAQVQAAAAHLLATLGVSAP